ncbi:MAG: ABC transporter substrate-binding protein [Rhizobiales bacterium]|nr:ABC transporter substrate-binding protein [Hyphomicrobiales bacterium]
MLRRSTATLLALAAFACPAAAADKIRFGTNWVAEAEHGGFYQAQADGTYAKYGLDVEIVPGGPQINNRILLSAGKLDFYISANFLQAFAAVEQNVPTIVVAAIMQRDPIAILAHPNTGIEKFEDLRERKVSLLLGADAMVTSFRWLKSEHGFRDEQARPYTFNPQPFLANKNFAMQGYVTSEPFVIEQAGGFKPKIFLLADHGFDGYATTLETRTELLRSNPDLVSRFIRASIEGWYTYLYGNSKPANDLIKKHNPEMTDALIAFSTAKMKEYGIVDSGDALNFGIGAMQEVKIKNFFDKMVKAGIVKADVNWRKSFDATFVNRKHGVDMYRLK